MPFLERAVRMVLYRLDASLSRGRYPLGSSFREYAQCLIDIIISYKNLQSILFIMHRVARSALSEDLLFGSLGKGLQPRFRSG